jgi:hypothetical protein
MAITTSGGNGTGSFAVAAANNYNTTLFTTPNTANTVFIVTITYNYWGTTFQAPAQPHIVKVGPNTPVVLQGVCPAGAAAGTVYWSYTYVGVTFG